MGGWIVSRTIDGQEPISYKFTPKFVLRGGQSVTVSWLVIHFSLNSNSSFPLLIQAVFTLWHCGKFTVAYWFASGVPSVVIRSWYAIWQMINCFWLVNLYFQRSGRTREVVSTNHRRTWYSDSNHHGELARELKQQSPITRARCVILYASLLMSIRNCMTLKSDCLRL